MNNFCCDLTIVGLAFSGKNIVIYSYSLQLKLYSLKQI